MDSALSSALHWIRTIIFKYFFFQNIDYGVNWINLLSKRDIILDYGICGKRDFQDVYIVLVMDRVNIPTYSEFHLSTWRDETRNRLVGGKVKLGLGWYVVWYNSE